MEAKGAWVNYVSSKIMSFFLVVFKTTNEFTTLILQWSKREIKDFSVDILFSDYV